VNTRAECSAAILEPEHSKRLAHGVIRLALPSANNYLSG
jgi:hypothetical protein